MKIAVTGAKGLLGGAMVRVLPVSVPGVVMLPYSRGEFDITDRDSVFDHITGSGADILINCAACTGVDQSENEAQGAYLVNVTAAGHIAEACRTANIKLIHISTDYVFDGTKEGLYTEEDAPSPIGAYALSKADGEKEVMARCPGALILRSAWLYGPDGSNFVTTIINKGRELGELNVVNDQFGSPTYTMDLTRAIGALIPLDVSGFLHVANSGFCSWHELAVEALKFAGLADVKVNPVTTDQYKTAAVRPKNTRLDTSLFTEKTGTPLRNWREALKEFIGGLPG